MKRNMIPHETTKGDVSIMERLNVLNKREYHAVLATDSDGQPYTSLVAYALAMSGKDILFATPKETQKYQNIVRNNRVSLLVDTRSNTERDYLGAESITILGRAHPIEKKEEWNLYAKLLTEKHPNLSEFIKASSTAIVLVEATSCIHVSQFQTVSEWNENKGRKD